MRIEKYIAVITAAALIVIFTAAFADSSANFPDISLCADCVEYFIEEVSEEEETAGFCIYAVSYGPVCNACSEQIEDLDVEVDLTEASETIQSTEAADPEMWIYTVDGSMLDIETQIYINNVLYELDIHDWMPVMMCQIYQESRNNHFAEASNLLDKGLLQFRSTYWPEYCARWGITADIYDSRAQIAIYAREIRQRLMNGETMEQAISDHYTGGVYFDATYVNDVLKWMNCIEKADLAQTDRLE